MAARGRSGEAGERGGHWCAPAGVRACAAAAVFVLIAFIAARAVAQTPPQASPPASAAGSGAGSGVGGGAASSGQPAAARERNPYAHLFAPGVTGKELIGQVVTRTAAVVDGNRLILGGVPFWLEGVDAPERTQSCLDRKRKRYDCGDRSRRYLEKLIGGREVTCAVTDQDKLRGATALCRVGEEDELGLQMVRDGWAFGFGEPGLRYLELQAEARKKKKGLWTGEFQMPQLWRRGYGLQPKTFSGQGLCLIKGNIEQDGSKRYYRPGDPGYDRVVVEFDQRERFFCNMNETIASGWRLPSPQCMVKGKIMPDGAKRYFLPVDDEYERTKISYKSGDRWFCESGEAFDNGFRRCLIKGVKSANGTKYYYQESHRRYRYVTINRSNGDRQFCFVQDAERLGYRLAP